MNSKDFYLINKVTKILLKCFNASSGTGQNVEAEPQDGKYRLRYLRFYQIVLTTVKGFLVVKASLYIFIKVMGSAISRFCVA
jgi:hypothetical protein